MSMNEIKQMLVDYQKDLDMKAILEKDLKDVNASIAAAKERIVSAMISEDCTSVGLDINGESYVFSPRVSVKYSKRSEEYLAEHGLNFFDVLRQEGLGDLIVETVNANTLNSAVRAYITENQELSPALDSVLSTYDRVDISRTKVRRPNSGR